MEKLISLLLLLVNKAQFNSEAEHDDALALLRDVAAEVGAGDEVPPEPGPTNAPAPEPPDVDPGVTAEPVPADEQPEPPNAFSGEPADTSNAFSTPSA